MPARVDGAGDMVLLEQQDRALWDPRLIALGFAHFERSAAGPVMTAYHIQAAIAAVHAGGACGRRRGTRSCGSTTICSSLNPSPVVALNRAVALSKVAGPARALEAIAALESDPALANYYLLPAVKGGCSPRWAIARGPRRHSARRSSVRAASRSDGGWCGGCAEVESGDTDRNGERPLRPLPSDHDLIPYSRVPAAPRPTSSRSRSAPVWREPEVARGARLEWKRQRDVQRILERGGNAMSAVPPLHAGDQTWPSSDVSIDNRRGKSAT